MAGSPVARMLCPPAGEARSASFPGRHERRPAVDDRIAPPETRVEYLGGQEIFAAPADEPHASQHSQIDRVIGAHVKPPYAVAVDMLTRTEDASDFAADVSVYEPIVHKKTGKKIGRRLEEIAFEVVHHQAQAVPTKKAVELVARGVRRVFCVFVNEHKLCEWHAGSGRWEPIEPGAVIEDHCFVRPITARALVDWVLTDDEVAKALLVKRPPAIVAALSQSRTEGRTEGHTEGRAEGRAEGITAGQLEEKRRGILRILDARGLKVSQRMRARIAATTDADLLDRWFTSALTVTRASHLID